jgi:hypothetical protein
VQRQYTAFVRFTGKPEQRWPGLTLGQANWRYHWIKRNWYELFGDAYQYGFEPSN